MYKVSYSRDKVRITQGFFTLFGAKLHLFFALLGGAYDGKITNIQ